MQPDSSLFEIDLALTELKFKPFWDSLHATNDGNGWGLGRGPFAPAEPLHKPLMLKITLNQSLLQPRLPAYRHFFALPT